MFPCGLSSSSDSVVKKRSAAGDVLRMRLGSSFRVFWPKCLFYVNISVSARPPLFQACGADVTDAGCRV